MDEIAYDMGVPILPSDPELHLLLSQLAQHSPEVWQALPHAFAISLLLAPQWRDALYNPTNQVYGTFNSTGVLLLILRNKSQRPNKHNHVSLVHFHVYFVKSFPRNNRRSVFEVFGHCCNLAVETSEKGKVYERISQRFSVRVGFLGYCMFSCGNKKLTFSFCKTVPSFHGATWKKLFHSRWFNLCGGSYTWEKKTLLLI